MTTASPLVSTSWLRARRDDPGIVILDASVYLGPAPEGKARGEFLSGKDAYLEDGHLPGAQFADLFLAFSDPTSPLPFARPSVEQFARAAGLLGIRTDTHVVIYDGLVGQWASRLWWVFHSFGHEKVSVLDGGRKKYLAEGGELAYGAAPAAAPAAYTPRDSTRRYASLNDVIDTVEGRQPGQLVCLLLPADYQGQVNVRRRAGHIPGSVNLPFTQLVDPASNALRSPAELRAAFEAVVDLNGPPVITYCGGGVASTLGSLALAVIGHHRTAEFDGSLAEWLQAPERPLSVGP